MTNHQLRLSFPKFVGIGMIILWSWVGIALAFNHGQMDFWYHQPTIEQIQTGVNLR